MEKFLKDSAVIREMLWKYRRQVSYGLIALVVVNTLEIVPALLIQNIVDLLTAKSSLEMLNSILIIYAVVTVIQALCRYAWRVFLVRASFSAGFDIRGRFAQFLIFLSMGFFSRKKVGDLMSHATNDTESIRMSLGGGLIILADAVFFLLTIPIAMYWMSPKLTLYVFATFPIIPFLVLRQEREIHRRFEKVQDTLSELAAMAQETVSGVRVIKAFTREAVVLERFAGVGKKFIRRSQYLAKVQSVFGPDLDFLMSFGLILLLYFGGQSIMEGTVTLGVFAAFQRFIQRMAWPMEAVGLSIAFYQRAVVGSQRLNKVYAEKTETPEPLTLRKDLPGLRSSKGHVQIKNLSFTYPGSFNPVLKNVNLEIPQGQSVALLGRIGSGKSTLFSLLPRLYQPPAQTIFLDNIDLHEWPLFDLRSQMAFVPQDGFLFSDTVAENVGLGLRSFDQLTTPLPMDRIEEATQRACVHEDVLCFHEGYETRLGERGVNVSGGQRQRLTLARALVQKSPLLILDDPLSAVDFGTEETILKSLRDDTTHQTVLIAAHRISTVAWADEIIVLEKGEVVQRGNHRALLKDKTGLYSRFYEQQRLQAELESYTERVEVSQ